MRELTWFAVITGAIIAIFFGAANAYIGLKIGMTISASIPAAVISMAIVRGIFKRDSILENNIVQTMGTAGEALATGMIFTIPALFVLSRQTNGEVPAPTLLEMTGWGLVGGILGVIMMVPLRRLLIVKEHATLPFPEGTACAEVLQSGERGSSAAKLVFGGLAVGGVYEVLRGLGFWPEAARQRIPVLKTEISIAAEPALLGVGFIIGARIAALMLAGAVLGWFVLIPAFTTFAGSEDKILYPGSKPIAQMTPAELHTNYIRYVGAGAVTIGGILSLLRNLGRIGGSLKNMIAGSGSGERTDRDLPVIVLLLALVGVGLAMWYVPQLKMQNLVVIACVIVFSFFFVTVSSRLVGLVGSSSNPASGMTIATLLGTALIFVVFNDGRLSASELKFSIIAVAALVCIAICIAGDVSQDLKTGFLVKATPWKQQVAMMIGIVAAVAVLPAILNVIGNTYGYDRSTQATAVEAPQANLMRMLVQGVVDGNLPWNLVAIGVAIALLIEMLGIPCLPVAVGLYLPFGLSSPLMIGGLLRWFVDRRRGEAKEGESSGLLGASGLVAGQGLAGVLLVAITAIIALVGSDPRFTPPFNPSEAAVAGVGMATAPASAPSEQHEEVVVARHFWPWISKSTGLPVDYGLSRLDVEAGAFRGPERVSWYHLIALIPFAGVFFWLMLVALRPMPPISAHLSRPPPGPHDQPPTSAVTDLTSTQEPASRAPPVTVAPPPAAPPTEHAAPHSSPPGAGQGPASVTSAPGAGSPSSLAGLEPPRRFVPPPAPAPGGDPALPAAEPADGSATREAKAPPARSIFSPPPKPEEQRPDSRLSE